MTSLAVELNYSNLNASRGRRHTINRNQEEEEINNNNNLTHNNTNNTKTNNSSTISTTNNINLNSSANNSNSFSNQYHQNHHSRYPNNTSNNVTNLTVSNAQYLSNSTKMPSPNIIYKLKTGNGVVTNNSHNNANESSSNSMSASFALINRIKSLEQQKKRNNQLSSTAIKAAAAAAAQACAAAIQATPISTNVSGSYRMPNPSQQQQQQQLKNSNPNLTNDILIESMHSMNINNASPSPINLNSNNNSNSQVNLSVSPNTERKSAKFNRNLITSFSKSQEELFKIRTKSANPNVYQDKITDQKFFNRNFKLKSDSSTSINDYSNSINNNPNNLTNSNSYLNPQQRFLNDSPSTTDSFYHSSKLYGSNTNLNTTNYDPNRNNYLLTNNSPANNGPLNPNNPNNNNNANHLNKLKLLKKRNALKKSLSNAASAQVGSAQTVATTLSATTSNTNLSNKSMDPLHMQSYSKEDLKLSHTSLNNLTSASVITTRNFNNSNNNLSRYSLNNIDSSINNNSFNTTVLNNSYSYPQLNNYGMNKSSETIDEINLEELKNKEINMSFRAKSTGPTLPNSQQNLITKTKSENELNDDKYLIQSYLNNASINNHKNASNLSINNNNNTDLNNNERTILNKLVNLNDEVIHNQKLHDNENNAETTDLFDLNNKRSNLASANKEKLKVNILIKPHSAIRQQQQHEQNHETTTQQSNGIQLPINDSTRLNKAVIANTTYLNRVKNGSSSHFNLMNMQTNLANNLSITNENQRNYSFNNANQRVKSGKLSNQVIIKRDNSNDSLERNNKIKLNNDNFSSNYRNLYSNANNNTHVGGESLLKPTSVYVEYTLDQIDPNNIMSDPVINEQFHKLYAEDEYFQAVHRKCTEWLTKYVLPEFELLKAERMQK